MKLTLFHRLLVIVCGVAAASTALALAIQDRALSRDLERAALARLETSAAAAEGLLVAHLRAMTDRYRAVSGTPQFRATLEVNDGPTLSHYAGVLASREGAARILFVDSLDQVVAAAGLAELDGRAVRVRGATLVAHDGRPYAVAALPLEAAGQDLGRLIAVEAVGEETVKEWSRLSGARVVFVVAGGPRATAAEAPVRDLGGLEMRVVSTLQAEHAALARSRRNLIAAGLLGLAAAFVASFFLSRELVRPILEIKEGAERIGRGDLTVQIRSHRGDEIGDVARAFEGMAGGLRATVGRVTEAANRVETTAAEIAAVIEQLVAVMGEQVRGSEHAAASMENMNQQVGEIANSAARSALALERAVDGSSLSFRELAATGDELRGNASALSSQVDEITASLAQMVESARQVSHNREELAAAAEQTTESMEEMAASAREVNVNAEQSAGISRRVVETAEQGRQRVMQTVDGMKAIQDATEEARLVIQGLDRRVTQIGSILTVIDHVTDETSLLALNASIIAAQSGEHGRAFSVVAGEMKALANRVLAGTREIHGLVRAVQEESGNATGAIERGSRSVESGVELAEEAGLSLEEITTAARESGGRMAEIVAATAGQTLAAGHVLDQMERVRGGAERIRGASAEQDRGNEVVLRNAVGLREVAGKVGKAIEAQGQGAARIGAGIETVRESVEMINRALREQSEACRQAAELLASSRTHTQTNEESVRRTEAAIRELLGQAELLREDVRRFQL